jgi:hypothetical protein
MPAPHHPPGPPAKPAQWFVFGGQVFDIAAATAIIRARPRETVSLPAGPWARAYGLDRDPGSDTGTIPLLGPGPGFDRAYAMTTDLAQPVIIATVPVSGGPPCPLLIDGTHRLYKATVKGRTHLPAWVLTQAETLAIRHRPGARPAPAARRRRLPGRESQP